MHAKLKKTADRAGGRCNAPHRPHAVERDRGQSPLLKNSAAAVVMRAALGTRIHAAIQGQLIDR